MFIWMVLLFFANLFPFMPRVCENFFLYDKFLKNSQFFKDEAKLSDLRTKDVYVLEDFEIAQDGSVKKEKRYIVIKFYKTNMQEIGVEKEVETLSKNFKFVATDIDYTFIDPKTNEISPHEKDLELFNAIRSEINKNKNKLILLFITGRNIYAALRAYLRVFGLKTNFSFFVGANVGTMLYKVDVIDGKVKIYKVLNYIQFKKENIPEILKIVLTKTVKGEPVFVMQTNRYSVNLESGKVSFMLNKKLKVDEKTIQSTFDKIQNEIKKLCPTCKVILSHGNTLLDVVPKSKEDILNFLLPYFKGLTWDRVIFLGDSGNDFDVAKLVVQKGGNVYIPSNGEELKNRLEKELFPQRKVHFTQFKPTEVFYQMLKQEFPSR